jgi:hypothetical protein
MTTTTEPATTEPATTEPATTEPATAPVPLYPQTLLRITATYHPSRVGKVLPPGQPETVDIELNELPAGDLGEFVVSLVDSLFRHVPEGGSVDVTHDVRGARAAEEAAA